jgi:hypothetical protein
MRSLNLRYTRANEEDMSVIEDTRRLLQDFLAPELRELSARVSSLEERMNARFESLEERMDNRFESLEERMDSRFDAAERIASERYAQTMQAIAKLADVYELRERVARIEARERTN